jgi:hypothetical protein
MRLKLTGCFVGIATTVIMKHIGEGIVPLEFFQISQSVIGLRSCLMESIMGSVPVGGECEMKSRTLLAYLTACAKYTKENPETHSVSIAFQIVSKTPRQVLAEYKRLVE